VEQQSILDGAMIDIDRLGALASLLAGEHVATAFADLSLGVQVAIFGTFEVGLQHVRAALVRIAHAGSESA
jgi:hypothetical protein